VFFIVSFLVVPGQLLSYFAPTTNAEKLAITLNLSYFIAKRINRGYKTGFSATLHKIAIVSISVGLSAAIVSFLVMKGFQETVKNKIFGFSGHLLITKYTYSNSPEESPMNFHVDVYDNVTEYPFIQHVQEYAHKPGLVKLQDEVLGVVIKGVGKSFDQDLFQENMLDGSFLSFPDSGYSAQVVISKIIADKLKAGVGDDIIIHFFQNPPRYRRLKVSGIYETNLSEYFDNKVVFGDIRMIQRLNDWSDSISGGLEVFLRPEVLKSGFFKAPVSGAAHEEDFEEDERGIAGLLNVFRLRDGIDDAAREIGARMDYDLNIERVSDRYIQVFDWLKLLNRQVNILLVIILNVISVNMISIILILVMERTQMIGLLKAMGAQDRIIRSVFVFNGVRLITRGLLFGNLIGLGVCFIQDKFKIVTLNAHDYYMSFVPISWNWEIVILLNILTFVVVTMVLMLPTMIIASVNPIKALRFD
jgi:lipoprotein-releasing system permease protein